ncbi:MAG: DUF3341 domain-containing protein [Oligoflexia bacterium]|nr:DUF3341 domain-containing protein [Oligoflexia bacterium]
MSNATMERPLIGVIGFFDEPGALVQATQKVRDAKFRSFDAYTPYPVHGLEAAQGLKRSPLPYVTLVAGITGCSLAFLFQYWTSAVDWPLIVGGKPFNSWPAWVPIMFELTVLFAGLSTVAAMFAFNGLPNIKRKSFDPSLTRDRFALVIEAPATGEEEEGRGAHRKFEEVDASQFLKQAGAGEVRALYAEGWF